MVEQQHSSSTGGGTLVQQQHSSSTGGGVMVQRSVCSRPLRLSVSVVVVVVTTLLLLMNRECAAQQAYNDLNGYYCNAASTPSCDTFLLYRPTVGYSDIPSIAHLFATNDTAVNETEMATLNGQSPNHTVALNGSAFVPINCSCFNGTYSVPIAYKIKPGDTFYDLNRIEFQWLSSVLAIMAANNVLPTALQPNQIIIVPVRCSCPSAGQKGAGTTSLVTYPVVLGDLLFAIANSFGVALADVVQANELGDANAVINADSTLLIPINSSAPTYTPPPPGLKSPPGPNAGTGVVISRTVSKPGYYIAVGVAVCVAILIVAAVAAWAFFTLWRRKAIARGDRGESLDSNFRFAKVKDGGSTKGPDSFESYPGKGFGDPLAGLSDLMDSDRPAIFTFNEIREATNNFSEGSKLQGSMYRGVLKGQVVAIKQTRGAMTQELRILCRVHHSNLVKLVGICVTAAEHLYLVYEYAENGSLSDCLHTDYLSKNNKLATRSSSYLSWTMRVQIALDVASGLEYIHDYVNPAYVHKDVKSSNILLDSGFRAKIANFAMAKSHGGDVMMTRHIAGTYGYMAPEYLAHGLVTTKADVFSFGVVVLELLSGQEAITQESGGEERCLYASIGPILEARDPEAHFKAWMDPILGSNFPMDSAMNLAILGKQCVDANPESRPSMKDVTFSLSNIFNSTVEWETSSVFASTLSETPIEAR